MRTFWGLTSRWTSRRAWAAARPRPTSIAYAAASSSGSLPEPVDPLLQRLAVDVLEDDVGAAAVLAGVDHRDDVRVRDLGDRARLAAEALDLVGLVGDLAVQDLGRDPALERLVAGQVDGRHAAAAELRLEPVAAGEHGSGQRPGRPCRRLAHEPLDRVRAAPRLRAP